MSELLQKLDPGKWHLSGLILRTLSELAEKNAASNFEPTQEEIYTFMEQPKEKGFGDFSLPCFRFAKPIKESPPNIAKFIKDKLDQLGDKWISKIEVKTAFLNFHIDALQIATVTLPSIKNQSYFKILEKHSGNDALGRVMIEFSQPNTHKEFHVGHGRNVCLGESIVRIFKYNGFQVTPVNYIGDEGTHVAKCLWQVKNYAGDVSEATNKAEWYGDRYVEANNKLKEVAQTNTQLKKEYDREISKILADLEKKKGDNYALWKRTREDCMQSFYDIYEWLNVNFDHYFYESEVSAESKAIVEEFKAKGLFTESDGAYGIDMKKYKLGYFMAQKSDGNTLYITKDLALAKRKFEDHGIASSIYVVGDEQNFHFKQLFKCLELMGFDQAKACHHLSYGMVVRPDGKMSSRVGNSFTFLQLKNLVEQALSENLKKYDGVWSEQQIKETAYLLANGSIKYGMLANDPAKEIVFDPEAWVSFEGNTGPYLMYAYARAISILSKAKCENFNADLSNLDLLTLETERGLLRDIYNFNNVILNACKLYKPSLIANYLYELSKSFNRFYKVAPIIKIDSEKLRGARLALIEAFAATSRTGLYLLGITPPEKM